MKLYKRSLAFLLAATMVFSLNISPVSAAVTKVVAQQADVTYVYDMGELVESSVDAFLGAEAPLFDHYRAADVTMVYDDVLGGYVTFADLNDAAMDAYLAGGEFDLDAFTENEATATDAPTGKIIYVDIDGKETPAIPEVDADELEVIEISAITETGIEVTFAALAADVTGISLEVKNPAGDIVPVKAIDLVAGATSATFTFETALEEVAVGTWTVNGKEYVKADEEALAVESVSAITETVALGGSYMLPTTVTATLEDGTTAELPVTWDKVAATDVLGTKEYLGTLTMVDGVINTDDVKVTATVTVVNGSSLELAKITNAKVAKVPFGTKLDETNVSAAMVTSAQKLVATGYAVSVKDATYNTTAKTWVGKFEVVNNNIATDKSTDTNARIIDVVVGLNAAPAELEVDKVTETVITTVPFGTANTKAAVEAAMLKLANAEVSTGYTVTLAPGSTYSTVTKKWVGTFIATNDLTPEVTKKGSVIPVNEVKFAQDISGAKGELAKITDEAIKTVPFGKNDTETNVKTAILASANAIVADGFTVTAASSEYNAALKIWTGKLTVTNDVTNEITATDEEFRTINIVAGINTQLAKDELTKVTDPKVTTVPFGTANTQAAVEAAMLKLANAEVGQGYTVTIDTDSTYGTVSKIWNGKFIVTNKEIPAMTAKDDAIRAITVVVGEDTSGATAELAKISDAEVKTVPFGTANVQANIEAAMVLLATEEIDKDNYKVEILSADGATYSDITKTWTGKFTVTSKTVAANTAKDVEYRSFEVIVDKDLTGAATELGKVNTAIAVVSELPAGTANTKAATEAAMLKIANTKVDEAYEVTIAPGSTYNTVGKVWNGKFTVTNKTEARNTATDANFRNLSITYGVSTAGAETELAKIKDATITTVANSTNLTEAGAQAAVEAEMVRLAELAIDKTNYKVEIAAGSTYSTSSKVWTGKLVVTNRTTAANTAKDSSYRTITVVEAVSIAGATSELTKIDDADVTTVPFGTANTQAAVEAAMLKLANAEVDSAYEVTIAEGSTYSTDTKLWTGTFIVTNKTTPAITDKDAVDRTIIVETAVSTAGARAALAKVTNEVITTLPSDFDLVEGEKAAVEAAIIVLAEAEINNGAYKVTIAPGSTYSKVSKVWSGQLVVTETLVSGNTTTDAVVRTITLVKGIDLTTVKAELAKVTDVAVKTVPFGTANTQATVEAAMLKLANEAITNTTYEVTIEAGSSYNTVTKAWNGKFVVTNKTVPTETTKDADFRLFTVVITAL